MSATLLCLRALGTSASISFNQPWPYTPLYSFPVEKSANTCTAASYETISTSNKRAVTDIGFSVLGMPDARLSTSPMCCCLLAAMKDWNLSCARLLISSARTTRMMLDRILYRVVLSQVVVVTATGQSTVAELRRWTSSQNDWLYTSVIFPVCLIGSNVNPKY